MANRPPLSSAVFAPGRAEEGDTRRQLPRHINTMSCRQRLKIRDTPHGIRRADRRHHVIAGPVGRGLIAPVVVPPYHHMSAAAQIGVPPNRFPHGEEQLPPLKAEFSGDAGPEWT